jgi:glycosyltransferase involved in cell wall biosynthesis
VTTPRSGSGGRDSGASDTAVAHWEQTINGGGERVAWELARTFDTDLHVGVDTGDCAPADVTVRELADGVAARALNRGGVAQMVASQLLWETPAPLREADLLVTSGNEPLSYVPRPEQTWLHYVHHTSRRATDRLNAVTSVAERAVRKVERQVYARYASKPDLLVCNSEPVARRVRRYWGVADGRIRVVHPPVPVGEFGPDLAPTETYHLALQRLDDHKMLREVVRAYRETDIPLLIAGDGPERDRLARLAADAPNVSLLGYVDEDRKRRLLSGAAASVVNAEREDFGLTTVEALASGTPVVGVAEGMTQHLVHDGVTGVTYERGVDNLRAAAHRVGEADLLNERGIAAYAHQFGADRFADAMREAARVARDRARVEPHVDPPRRAVADGGEGQR